MGKLALPKCDKCSHKWYARYRRINAPKFYCPCCGRVHPRWTAEDILKAHADAYDFKMKLQPLHVSV